MFRYRRAISCLLNIKISTHAVYRVSIVIYQYYYVFNNTKIFYIEVTNLKKYFENVSLSTNGDTNWDSA